MDRSWNFVVQVRLDGVRELVVAEARMHRQASDGQIVTRSQVIRVPESHWCLLAEALDRATTERGVRIG